MTLEETAQQVLDKIDVIVRKSEDIRHLCGLVVRKNEVDSDVFQLSDEDKQKLIQHYQTRKTELQQLISELP